MGGLPAAVGLLAELGRSPGKAGMGVAEATGTAVPDVSVGTVDAGAGVGTVIADGSGGTGVSPGLAAMGVPGPAGRGVLAATAGRDGELGPIAARSGENGATLKAHTHAVSTAMTAAPVSADRLPPASGLGIERFIVRFPA
jgi:hypothetical protein